MAKTERQQTVSHGDAHTILYGTNKSNQWKVTPPPPKNLSAIYVPGPI